MAIFSKLHTKKLENQTSLKSFYLKFIPAYTIFSNILSLLSRVSLSFWSKENETCLNHVKNKKKRKMRKVEGIKKIPISLSFLIDNTRKIHARTTRYMHYCFKYSDNLIFRLTKCMKRLQRRVYSCQHCNDLFTMLILP